MSEYTVLFNDIESLGISFVHCGGKSLYVDQLSSDCNAHKLGLLSGDQLISINNKSIITMTSSQALYLFNQQCLPFEATFRHMPHPNDPMNLSIDSSIKPRLTLYQTEVNMDTPDSFMLTPDSPHYIVEDDHVDGKTDGDRLLPSDLDYLSVSEDTASGYNSLSSISVSMTPSASDDILDDLMDLSLKNVDQSTNMLITGYIRNLLREYKSDLNLKHTMSNIIKPHKSKIASITYLSMLYFNGEGVRENEEDNVKLVNLSANGFKSGKHEWTVRILKCDVYRQEVGIVSHWKEDIKVEQGGIISTPLLRARAVFGNELSSNKCYYASYNADNKQRVHKDLSNNFLIGWCTGDEIKISLDCDKGNIKFYLNNNKVRKTISIQKKHTYYPIISFSGNCKYEVISFK